MTEGRQGALKKWASMEWDGRSSACSRMPTARVKTREDAEEAMQQTRSRIKKDMHPLQPLLKQGLAVSLYIYIYIYIPIINSVTSQPAS